MNLHNSSRWYLHLVYYQLVKLSRFFTNNLFGRKDHQFLFILTPPYCGSTLLNQILSTSKNLSCNNHLGVREGQLLPEVKNILKGKENEKILLYCTGGIRCEKASSYLIKNGFKDINQLQGGIIQYAHEMKEKSMKSKFKGKNFVFDERKGERISEEIISKCHQCGAPSDIHVNCDNQACHLLFIQCESCQEKMQTCCSSDCQDIINLPEEEQKALRKGKYNSNKIFKKGRSEVLKFKQ